VRETTQGGGREAQKKRREPTRKGNREDREEGRGYGQEGGMESTEMHTTCGTVGGGMESRGGREGDNEMNWHAFAKPTSLVLVRRKRARTRLAKPNMFMVPKKLVFMVLMGLYLHAPRQGLPHLPRIDPSQS
jgi:hypothetical protein